MRRGMPRMPETKEVTSAETAKRGPCTSSATLVCGTNCAASVDSESATVDELPPETALAMASLDTAIANIARENKITVDQMRAQLDPERTVRKFASFGKLDADSAHAGVPVVVTSTAQAAAARRG